MPNIGDRIKLTRVINGSKDYIGYVHAQNQENPNSYLIRFPGWTSGHEGIDDDGSILGEAGSKEFWWLGINDFKVTEEAKPITYIDLMIE